MSWAVKTIGELCDQSNGVVQTGPFGSQLKQSEYIDDVDGVPVVMPKDIKEGSVDENEIARISERKAATLSRHMLSAGDIVFPRRGEISKRGYIKESGKYFCGTGCLKIHMPDNEVLNRYLFYYLDQDHVVKWLEGRAIGSTMLNLNTSIMRSVNINFPDLQSQEKIVSTLSAYDDLIENNNRRIELLEETARQLYKEWFVRFRFPGYEHVKIIEDIPEGWTNGCIGDIARVCSGYAFKSKDWLDEGNPVIKIKNITSFNAVDISECQCIDDNVAEKANKFKLTAGDLLIAMTGATVGKIGIMPTSDRTFYLNQRVGKFESKLGRDVTSLLLPFFNSKEAQASILNLAGGAAQPNISAKQIESIKLTIPPESILNAFLDEIENLFSLRLNLIDQNSRLTQARDLLLPKLMTGEIAV